MIETNGLGGIDALDAISSVADNGTDVVIGLSNGGSVTLAELGSNAINSIGALDTLLTAGHIDVN